MALYLVTDDLCRDRGLHLDLMSPGVHQLLNELTGLRLAIVSSARRCHLEPILSRVNLLERFETIVTREDVTELKPHPEPYQTAAQRLGISRALVVEDSEAGLASGRAAGFDVLFIPDYSQVPTLVRAALTAPQNIR